MNGIGQFLTRMLEDQKRRAEEKFEKEKHHYNSGEKIFSFINSGNTSFSLSFSDKFDELDNNIKSDINTDVSNNQTDK